MPNLLACFLLLTTTATASAQDRIFPSDLIARAEHDSALTAEGRPFHAMLEIGKPKSTYSGRVEVWWSSPTQYRSSISSPQFSRTLIVNGGSTQETTQGDYLPRWLADFEDAILNPLATRRNFVAGSLSASTRSSSSGEQQVCIRRDDRPGGITDQMTWGDVCFNTSGKFITVASVLTFNHNIDLSDFKGFGDKHIARTYTTYVLDYQGVKGTLTKLEPLAPPSADFFEITQSTPAPSRYATAFVSSETAANMIEHAPVIEWPTVREGKTEGYMIVYARTDRTGQVRETAKHNSDQPGLESFGMQQALLYKFKPLVSNGEASQMEMPLVLHFTSKLADPLPILTVEQMKVQTIACNLSAPKLPVGKVVTFRISVNEMGKATGTSVVDTSGTAGALWLDAMVAAGDCRFRPYVVNGKPTYYKGDVQVVGR